MNRILVFIGAMALACGMTAAAGTMPHQLTINNDTNESIIVYRAAISGFEVVGQESQDQTFGDDYNDSAFIFVGPQQEITLINNNELGYGRVRLGDTLHNYYVLDANWNHWNYYKINKASFLPEIMNAVVNFSTLRTIALGHDINLTDFETLSWLKTCLMITLEPTRPFFECDTRP